MLRNKNLLNLGRAATDNASKMLTDNASKVAARRALDYQRNFSNKTDGAASSPDQSSQQEESDKREKTVVEEKIDNLGLSLGMTKAVTNFSVGLGRMNPVFANAFREYSSRNNLERKEEIELNRPKEWMALEKKFQLWSEPLSKEYQKKCQEVLRNVEQIVQQDKTLSTMPVKVFALGSYRSGTNNLDSDIDLCVCCQEPLPNNIEEFRNFRNLVKSAFVGKYGNRSIIDYNSSISVNKDHIVVNTDIITAFSSQDNTTQMDAEFFSLDGNRITIQEQSYKDREEKQKRTSGRYNQVVRIFKNLRDEMQNSDLKKEKKIRSAFIESLVYNAPDNAFGHETLVDDVNCVLDHCIRHTFDDKGCRDWRGFDGATDLLFNPSEKWTPQQAHEFLLEVQKHIS